MKASSLSGLWAREILVIASSYRDGREPSEDLGSPFREGAGHVRDPDLASFPVPREGGQDRGRGLAALAGRAVHHHEIRARDQGGRGRLPPLREQERMDHEKV